MICEHVILMLSVNDYNVKVMSLIEVYYYVILIILVRYDVALAF